MHQSPTAPKQQIHTHSTVETESKVIRITLTAADIAQLKRGLINEDEIDDMIDVTPQPVRPMREIIAELEAAQAER
jgi:hypothetical protein